MPGACPALHSLPDPGGDAFLKTVRVESSLALFPALTQRWILAKVM
jgi:hypothetical protein